MFLISIYNLSIIFLKCGPFLAQVKKRQPCAATFPLTFFLSYFLKVKDFFVLKLIFNNLNELKINKIFFKINNFNCL